MPENYVLRVESRLPLSGKFSVLPLASYREYGLARYVIFSVWAQPDYYVDERFVHGSIAEGSLILGQRPVSHCGMQGDVVFELPYLPLSNTTSTIRILDSLTWGLQAYYGRFGQMGVLMPDGTSRAPKNGVFSTSGFAVSAIDHNLPFGKYAGYADSERGYRYDNMVLTPTSISYTMSDRDWLAMRRSDGSGFVSAAGWKQEWAVSVELRSGKFYCLAHTTSNLQVKVVGGTLVWYSVGGLSNNRTLNVAQTITSGAFGASFRPASSFIAEVERTRLWASTDLYANEHRQVLNDALDEYRTLRSNNIENALQWSRIEKMLPLEAARLVPLVRGTQSHARKALLVAKISSSLYLWWRYAVSTTYRDLKELTSAVPDLLPKEGQRNLRARVTTSKAYDHPNQTWVAATCCVSPYNLSLLPLRWGIHPGLSQSWDLIPFSFVVDWFFGVSNQLNAIDWFIYRAFLRLDYLIRTRRTEVIVDAGEFGGAGYAIVSFYKREISLTWPGFLDSIPNPRGVPIKNWATAAAALAISLLPGPR